MRIFHTADWHLGKLVQGVYMTEDQQYVLEQFVADVEQEKPDVVIIAGDLYDRAIPPPEAVKLLDSLLAKIVLQLKTPVIAIAGNHDSPSRLDFGGSMMRHSGFHIAGELAIPLKPVILHDEYGEVHFYLIPYAEPAKVRHLLQDETIKTHDDAAKAVTEMIKTSMDPHVRHVVVGHAFVTPGGAAEENTSDSEKPLAIGGVEYVNAQYYERFAYTALGHLHQAHHVAKETIRYAGSPLKYSISEQFHRKGYSLIELDASGQAVIEHRSLMPKHDMRMVEGFMSDIEQHPVNDDYVFVHLLDETPVLSPMERVRAVYPNAMHVTRHQDKTGINGRGIDAGGGRAKLDDLSLFRAFYREVRMTDPSSEIEALFTATLQEVVEGEGESYETVKINDDSIRSI